MRLRIANLGDLDAVLGLERECFEAPHWTRRDYLGVLEGVNHGAVRRRTFLCEDDSKILGFIVAMLLVTDSMRDAQIENLAVATSARRRGVGRTLCQACIDWCIEEDSSVLGLEVRASNLPAISLYRRLGFTEIGNRSRYYANPVEDALVMELTLAH